MIKVTVWNENYHEEKRILRLESQLRISRITVLRMKYLMIRMFSYGGDTQYKMIFRTALPQILLQEFKKEWVL